MDSFEEFSRFHVTIEVIIRPCVEADLPALEWMGLFSPHRDIIRQAFEAQERGDALMLLGVSAGFPVGQVWIDFTRRKSECAAFVWAVRTFHPLQGRGIGLRLMQAAEAVLRSRGIGRAELGVERSNQDALRFYERLGWRIVAPLQESFSSQGPDGAAMVENLDQWLLTKEMQLP